MTDVRETVESIEAWAEEIRRQELKRFTRPLQTLPPGERKAVERLTLRIVGEFLAGPLERLRASGTQRDSEELYALAAELFCIHDDAGHGCMRPGHLPEATMRGSLDA